MSRNYSKELISFVDGLIEYNASKSKDGYELSVHELSQSDLQHFAAHLIKHKSFENEGWDWLLDDTGREEVASQFGEYILEWKKNRKQELLQTFTFDLIDIAVCQFKDKMQEMINERLGPVEHEEMTSAGFIAREYPDNGEIYWGKV